MEGGSPDRLSAESGAKRYSVSSGGRTSVSSSSGRKEFFRKLMDSEMLTEKLGDWFSEISEKSACREPAFDVPFELTELQKFDYALEGVSFQQLIRMPSAVYASTSDSVEATAYLAIEDFLHASAKGLWETFWGQDPSMPFSVSCLYGGGAGSKFYPAERAIASGKLGGLCAIAIMLKNSRHSHGKWDQILELALLRPDVGTHPMESDRRPSLSILGEALFFALRVLLSRSLNRSNVLHNSNCVYVLLVDSQYGGVVKVEGDVNKLNLDVNNVYECAAEWIKEHSQITVSPVDRIWNKLGNANWGDIGALQVLLATFHCIVQFSGMPKLSVSDLASHHSNRLRSRRSERQLDDTRMNGNGLFRFQNRSFSPEIVEVQEESIKVESEETMKLEPGSILWLDDSNLQKGFQINEVLTDGEFPIYCATPIEEPGKALLLYVGSHPSQLEPAWEDMSLWYQVQRQTKILTVMKQRGVNSKYLPLLVASGRIVHPGQCRKPSSVGNCDHPWCGTPILVTSPVGEFVSDMVRSGQFGSDEALRCCHDCLSALSVAASAGVRHSDIRPENVIRVSSGVKHPYYVIIGWGHAILEDRDRPAMNLLFSSTYALQEGKLCSASDAESLIYLLYFSCGGILPDLDSVEGALQWREASWSRRLIQQKLGDISTVLKAFADYVDSLCGTPYPMDYEIWLRRLRKTIHGEEHGKEIDPSG
ncbi:protein kinase superfamily protein [Tasmannia lanceolata]|uniref:protein kinase superfamily protein n=1 Tax=Tasmannia lanceolata TaxID=3420 RepID=UPI0040632768